MMKEQKLRGYSLVELLVVVAVVGVVGVLLLQLWVQNSGVFYQQSAKLSHGIGLNNISSRIQADIKSSQAVAAGYPEPAPYQYTSSSSTIVLKIPSIDGSKNIIDGVFDFIVIAADLSEPAILRRQLFPDNQSSREARNEVFLTSLSSLDFDYFDSSLQPTDPATSGLVSKVNFTVEVTTNLGGSDQIDSTSGEVYLRND